MRVRYVSIRACAALILATVLCGPVPTASAQSADVEAMQREIEALRRELAAVQQEYACEDTAERPTDVSPMIAAMAIRVAWTRNQHSIECSA